MRKQEVKWLAVLAAGLLMAGRALAGSLDPTNAPGPTMHTLQELYDKVKENQQAILSTQLRLESIEMRISAPTAPDGMVLIPAGTNSGTDPDFGAYSLTVADFCMDRSEVTKAQWDAVYAWAVTNGYRFDNAGSGKTASHPVQTVNWYDTVKWCNARSEKEGRSPCYTTNGVIYKTGQNTNADCNFFATGYRLPTNTEWEYAVRGGLSGKRFPWGDTITHSNANYNSSASYSYDVCSTRGYNPAYTNGAIPYTSVAGSFSANSYGLYDMAGNVYEWCWDQSGSDRGVRGGGWYYFAYYARCGKASWRNPDYASDSYGIRSVCR
ncbi:MAG: SUMF1/EgtB/PvdO family nonheme iron enzyme [Kiritimatiellales bacterium]